MTDFERDRRLDKAIGITSLSMNLSDIIFIVSDMLQYILDILLDIISMCCSSEVPEEHDHRSEIKEQPEELHR